MMMTQILIAIALCTSCLPCFAAEEQSQPETRRSYADRFKERRESGGRMSYAERLQQRRESLARSRSTRAVELLVLLRGGKQGEVIDRLEQDIDKSVCAAWQTAQSAEGDSHDRALDFLRKMKEYRSRYPAGSTGDQATEANRILEEIKDAETVQPPPELDK